MKEVPDIGICRYSVVRDLSLLSFYLPRKGQIMPRKGHFTHRRRTSRSEGAFHTPQAHIERKTHIVRNAPCATENRPCAFAKRVANCYLEV